jgi:ribonuclease HI
MGGCSGNPGPGGWAFVAVQEDQALQEQAGAAEITTNNQMELTAVIEGLRWAISQGHKALEIHTDSQYVKNGITTWIHNWIKNGWKTAAKKPVKKSGILDPTA